MEATELDKIDLAAFVGNPDYELPPAVARLHSSLSVFGKKWAV